MALSVAGLYAKIQKGRPRRVSRTRSKEKVARDTDLINAQELMDHTDPKITEDVYSVKPKVVRLNKEKSDK
jgi:hypothetical protein